MNYEVHHAVAVAKYIVIPGNELYKVVAETNFNPTIKDETESIAFKFPGDNLVQASLQCLSHYLLDVLPFVSFLQVGFTMDTLSRNVEGHTIEHRIQLWNACPQSQWS